MNLVEKLLRSCISINQIIFGSDSTIPLFILKEIILGLFFGKQIGVMLFTYLGTILKICKLPSDISWSQYYGLSLVTGIGFTMSLFVGNLAFADNTQYIDGVKIGVLIGSLLSTIFGYFLLLLFTKK